ncbi:NnrU family protein [Roseovarius sp. SCSIO 43702]|uniref:NnrU family protein n=1 Tax=Roseovarius sp. SCSIO 43702 TaxID=2823043 RepID=UPI001C7381E1|nr:NnrU family protein [Roseovarius sp. SCSIO 43702]QYX56199.1 NnrU family protein [Roseovarius sp. SCSIO 43702]
MGWTGFALTFVAFFITHSIPLRPPVRARGTAMLGARGYMLAYSALSLGMLALLIHAAGRAPYVELWPQMMWQRHVVHLGMLVVCLLLGLSIAQPNPFSFGGAKSRVFDPERPGIVGWVRHPLLVALALWAGLHLLPNGDLAHVLLFGVLGGFALMGGRLVDRRKRRELGTEKWTRLRQAVRDAPKLYRPRSLPMFLFRLAAGVVLFAALVAAHPVVIGVPAV